MADVEAKLDKITKQNKEILGKLNKMEKEYEKVNKRLDKAHDLIKNIKEEVSQIIDSQNFLNEEHSKQKTVIENVRKIGDKMMKRDTDREKELQITKEKMKEYQRDLINTQHQLNDLEQYGRRNMVDIKGIPFSPKENTDKIVKKIGALMSVDIDLEDIEISHRTSSLESASIIVKFQSRRKRNEFWLSRKKLFDKNLGDIGFSTDRKFYIGESLTPRNGHLFKMVRDRLVRTKLYRYAWTHNGVIFVKEDEGSQKIIIKSVSDIERLEQ